MPSWGNFRNEEIIINSRFAFIPWICRDRFLDIIKRSDARVNEKKLEWKFNSSVVVTSKHEWTWKS